MMLRCMRCAAQVEEAVGQPRLLVDVVLREDRERQRVGGAQHLDLEATSTSTSPVGSSGLTLSALRASTLPSTRTHRLLGLAAPAPRRRGCRGGRPAGRCRSGRADRRRGCRPGLADCAASRDRRTSVPTSVARSSPQVWDRYRCIVHPIVGSSCRIAGPLPSGRAGLPQGYRGVLPPLRAYKSPAIAAGPTPGREAVTGVRGVASGATVRRRTAGHTRLLLIKVGTDAHGWRHPAAPGRGRTGDRRHRPLALGQRRRDGHPRQQGGRAARAAALRLHGALLGGAGLPQARGLRRPERRGLAGPGRAAPSPRPGCG